MTSSSPTTFPEPAHEKESDTRTPPVVVAALVTLAREAPGLCDEEIIGRLEREYGVRLTKETVTRLLYRHGVRTAAHRRRSERMRQAEARLVAGEPVPGWLCRKLLKANPALKERERETGGPGERVCVAHFPVFNPGVRSKKGRVWVHVHMAVDTFGGMAVAEFYREATTDAAMTFLGERILPFYRGEGVTLACVETNRSQVYSGDRRTHLGGPYPQCLRMLGVRHEVRGRMEPTVNGHMEKFVKAFTNGFVEPLRYWCGRKEGKYSPGLPVEALARLRGELAEWLRHYNEEEPQEGYRNAGLTPRAFWQGGRGRPCGR
ncbi:hypothetical protein OpiT1DRAFT_01445 [Opitutaceae bacterium TAV1]|nr:hypothetical protein OpiT1DRAFT_01445 [Opitutaceae bacterium TAV1]